MTRAALLAAVLMVVGCGAAPKPTPSICPGNSECLEWDCKFDTSDTPRECVCIHELR